MENFIDFLLEAKKQTYANGNALISISSRSESKDYEYSREIGGKKFIYHDTFFGGINFIGEERGRL